MPGIVESPLVKDSKLLTPKPVFSRPYVFPFLPLYATFFQIYTSQYDKYIGGSEWTFVYFGALVSLNLLVRLLPAWNKSIEVLFNYVTARSIQDASHIYIKPTPNNGSSDIVKIEKLTEGGVLQTFFQFQKKRFLLDNGVFKSPQFLIDEPVQLKVFQNNKGNTGDLVHIKRIYGENKFDIPVPTFVELFKEHAIAPFFVFQIFCIALWLFDDLWYYSLLNLFMVVMMEAANVFQRLTTLKEFRTMGVKPYAINVLRNGKWVQLQTDQLLPNDLVSITRSDDDVAIPCDLLLISGSCIVNEAMLSGESTPLIKESIQLRPGDDYLDLKGVDKNSVLHGGTKCLQVTPPEKCHVAKPPDGGCLAVVTKTGFETSQGSLVRVMLFSAERVSANNTEAFMFILFLLNFAIAASWYVWVEGTKMGRIQSKLILDCILIVTSVVPPELPMELTMAVNSSLGALSKFYVYCTEPFRIPLAGRIDVCCFDKTGTLTGEDLVFEGLAGLNKDDDRHLHPAEDASLSTALTIGSCHALVKLEDGEIVGDPMEKATLQACGWKVDSKNFVSHSKHGKVEVLRRFQFSSSLKRSSSIAVHKGKLYVSVKGAPETIRSRLVELPSNYDAVYKSFTRSGSRVLALASKELSYNLLKKVNDLKREDMETGLKFEGFLIFHCPLKDDAIETIKMLNESSHRCIMITGDNPLTAVHVANEVKIVERATLILDQPGDGTLHKLVFRSVDESIVKPFNPEEDDIDSTEIFGKYDLAVTGHALKLMETHKQIKDLIKHTWVYARVSPSQKEYLLNTYKDMGYNTLMCGDGTNDVGALKQAHVGIALLNGTEEGLKKLQEQRKIEKMQDVYGKQCDLFTRWGKPVPPVPQPIAHLYPPGPNNPNYLKALESRGTPITEEIRQAVAKAMTEKPQAITSGAGAKKNASGSEVADMLLGTISQAGDDEDAPSLKLGDASCAAPFTSKLANVSAVTNVVRQGRCALINTIQMYKILALNCLISAYSLSVIYMSGVKFGDGQSTVSGLLLSVCFLSISRGKPNEKLSKQRPQAGIFNAYIMGSILSQFAVHIFTLIYLTKAVYVLEPREPQIDLEKKFEPSLLNTAIFLIQLVQQVSTFAVNYQGEPFRENIRNNKGMYYGLIGVAGLALASATEFMPELNEAMKFVPMDSAFKFKLTSILLIDFFGSYLSELFFKYLFMDDKPADIAHQ
ncbi:ion-transporting P-type ATPase SPF1 SCDLUD_003384 [Saccharomycodes ludwigii]|uniref:ion-transporting P-type ATPase SPF1 n=1 Tax=Saccharomycodes ludwigii TaxID=36035 RepID=UPI001E8712E7|nr:hypothetical protein SCDLUD_003384 [Saccharomycodes ludwigii]KAH3900405.1 hypothetical protein SCDLUD_003384 [Saccharomycodes ludwigii]